MDIDPRAENRAPRARGDDHDETDKSEWTSATADLDEMHSVKSASRLSARLVYAAVKRDGEEELARPSASLVWSGVAAGMLIAFSLVGEGVLRMHLPPAPWRPLVENFGYTLGFLLVIIGRMQLFTENTITTVLPLVSRRSRECALSMARLWSIVLASNVVGAFLAAAFMALTPAFSPEFREAAASICRQALAATPAESLFKSMPAGMLIAAIVWMLPSARNYAFLVIVAFTWLIAAAGFGHVVVGAVEMIYMMLRGEAGASAIWEFFLPVLVGNIVGGTVIFALLAWGQVRYEISAAGARRAHRAS